MIALFLSTIENFDLPNSLFYFSNLSSYSKIKFIFIEISVLILLVIILIIMNSILHLMNFLNFLKPFSSFIIIDFMLVN